MAGTPTGKHSPCLESSKDATDSGSARSSALDSSGNVWLRPGGAQQGTLHLHPSPDRVEQFASSAEHFLKGDIRHQGGGVLAARVDAVATAIRAARAPGSDGTMVGAI